MLLEPRQLSSLHEMGIAVWELKKNKVQKPIAESVMDSVAVISQQQLLETRCFVLFDAENHTQQSQQLLTAIFFAIGLSLEQVTLISIEQVAQLEVLNDPQKLLIIMGNDLQLASLSPWLKHDQTHQIVVSIVSIMITLSLSSLLSEPNNKARVWQDLKLVKEFLDVKETFV